MKQWELPSEVLCCTDSQSSIYCQHHQFQWIEFSWCTVPAIGSPHHSLVSSAHYTWTAPAAVLKAHCVLLYPEHTHNVHVIHTLSHIYTDPAIYSHSFLNNMKIQCHRDHQIFVILQTTLPHYLKPTSKYHDSLLLFINTIKQFLQWPGVHIVSSCTVAWQRGW